MYRERFGFQFRALVTPRVPEESAGAPPVPSPLNGNTFFLLRPSHPLRLFLYKACWSNPTQPEHL